MVSSASMYGDSLLAVCFSRQDADILDIKKKASVKADCCTFGNDTHMNDYISVSVEWRWKVIIETVYMQGIF